VIPPHSTPASDFATLLRRFRLARGLSQEELAMRAGVSVTSVSYIERGLTRQPHRDTLELLIAALELAPDEAAILAQAARRARATAVDTTVPTPAEALSSSPERPSSAMPFYRLSPPLTPLLGREHEEAGIVHLLGQERVRLVTLTGPAGVGKTRLALQVAATLADQLHVALTLVDLVTAPTADQVLYAIAQALGVHEVGDLPLLEALIATIGDRHLVLMLDNFEHVLEAAPLCTALLGRCPHTKALVTSRSALNIRGEHEFAVPPLQVPDLSQLPPLAHLEHFGAVALFLERARTARTDFALSTLERGRLVAATCVWLDGLPLAIELAAAQLRHFPLADLAARVQGAAALDLLVGGPRDLADHQRAMRSTVAWSYGLLSPPEQRVFRALGVFAGGATVGGLQTVADLGEETAAASLRSLVDASLALRIDPPSGSGETRFDLLVIMRAFALERLREAGELEAAQHGLADYIVGLVEQLSPTSVNVQTAQVNRLLREHDNLRAVLDWLLESGSLRVGLRVAARLRALWEARGLAAEGAAWLERLLAGAKPSRTPEELDAQVEAWKVLVVMRYRLGHFEDAVEAAERVVALTREQGDPAKLARSLHYLGNPLAQFGEFDRAETILLEGLAINRMEGQKTDELISLINLGDLRRCQGRYAEALAIEEEALALSRSLAEQDPSLGLILANLGETYILMDRPTEAQGILLESQQVFESYDDPTILALYNLGRACWRLGTSGDALAYLERAAQLSRRQDDIAALVQELCVIAGIALDHDNLALAWQALDEASATQARASNQHVRWRVVERVAGYACRLGAWETSGRLYAAAAQGRSRILDLIDPAERALQERDRAAALGALGLDAIVEAERIGSTLALPQALALARVVLAQSRPAGQ
jgi:predicted ATPase/transcriptional regulator with XRE-family HTH domain